MNDDQELKRMFVAARAVDSESVPSFDKLAGEARVRREANRRSSPIAARTVIAGILMAALAVTFIRFDNQNVSPNPAVTQTLDQICNSLADRLSVTDAAAQPNLQEMTWTTSTDSLLPFDTLHFDEGKIR